MPDTPPPPAVAADADASGPSPSPSSSPTPRGLGPRRSLAHQFVAQAVVQVGLLLFLAGWAIWSLHQVADASRSTVRTLLPALEITHHLAMDAAALANLAQGLVSVASDGERRTLMARIDGRAEAMNRQVERLRLINGPAAELALVLDIKTQVMRGISVLDTVTGQVIAARAAFDQRVSDLAALCQVERPPAGCAEALALAAAPLDRPGAAAPLAARRAAGGVAPEVAAGLDGAGGLLALRAEVALAIRRLGNLASRQEAASGRLTSVVTLHAAQLEARVRDQQQAAAAQAEILRAILIAATVAGVVGLGLLYRGVRRSIIGRLVALGAAMAAWRSSGRLALSAELSSERNDELADVTRAFAALVGAVEARTAQLHHLAITDPLTGLPNRRHFMEQAARVLRQAQRYGHPVTVLVADIDHFKRINDTYGHSVGDLALVDVAARWRSLLRDVDIPCRLGGEELAALLPETTLADGLRVAERIRATISGSIFHTPDGDPLRVSVSIGVAQARGASLDALMVAADTALYAAKAAGRDCVRAGPGGG